MKKLFSNPRFKWAAIFALIALICLPIMGYVTAGIVMASAPLMTMDPETVKQVEESVAKQFEAKGAELRKNFEDQIKKFSEDQQKELTAKLEKFTNEELATIKEEAKKLGVDNLELKQIIATQGTTIKSLQEKGMIVQQSQKATPVTMREKMAAILKGMFVTEEFKELSDRNFEGATKQYTLTPKGEITEKYKYDDEMRKAAVAVSTDHTGTVLISEISQNVRAIPVRKSHIRNLMTVRPTDKTAIVAPEVYDFTDPFTMGADVLAENTEAPTSAFKTKENTWSVKRIARSIEISKRYFKTNGLDWVINWILSRLPDQMQYAEDFQLLFGDGAGNNVSGIVKEGATGLTLTKAFIATSFASHATYNGGTQTLITFAAAHGMNNGDKLTLANTNAAAYDGDYIIKVKDATTVLIDKAFAADATVAAAWTGTWKSYWYHSIDNATEFDAITVAAAMLNAGEYQATGVVLHSNTAERINLTKDLNAGYIGIARDAMGRMVISAMPIAITNAIPAGFAIVGDFQRACELAEYTPLSLQISEDTTDKKKNQVTVIAEEEIIFPVYNPLWFKFFSLEDAKTAIELP